MQLDQELQNSAIFDPNKGKSQVCYTLDALLYKSIKLQQRNYCSNICQIITPLVCIAFTLVAQLISDEIVSGKIQSFPYPQPLDMPYFYTLAQSSLNLSCNQHYIYEVEGDNQINRKNAQKLLDSTLKFYCDSTNSLMPKFTQINNSNAYLMQQLKIGDKEAFQRGDDLKTDLPDGKIIFKDINANKLNVTYGINDWRLPQYHKNNGITKILMKSKDSQQLMSYLRVTEGMMGLLEKINRAYLQFVNPKQVIMGSIMYMPFDGEDKSLKNKIINILGSGLYPLGLGLLLPLFLYNIVTEKEQRLIQIMKMNGLNVKYYWVNTFIFNFFISMLTFTLFYVFGRYYLALTLFVETGFFVFWALLIGWAIAQIAMTNFVQIFINSAKSATIVGYLLSIFSCFIGQAITTFIYAYPQKVPVGILLYPPFALCRAIYLIGYNCASNSSCYKGLTQVESEFNLILGILFGWFFIYLISIWLNDMVQQQYGVAKYPKPVRRCLERMNRKSANSRKEELIEQINTESIEYAQLQLNQSTELVIQDPVHQQIDHSVHQQEQVIDKLAPWSKPMIIKGLSKKYPHPSGEDSDYIALKPLTVNMEQKEIFGLLGPNGAGKTTMISVLTGMYPQTAGNAWINGIEVGSSYTNKFIGVCPQFDLLWPDLTVYEHLKFYSKLKMVQSDNIEQQIDNLLLDVDLKGWKQTVSSQLSGGMQRRLSLAISLVGNPRVVFLDEPSSGLDPSHRRQMWNILLKCKKRTSILLTTHLMDEAQVLCDRVGIIHKGQLRCIGDIHSLKQKFGKGYRLTMSYNLQLKQVIERRRQSSGSLKQMTQQNLMKATSIQEEVSHQSQKNSGDRSISMTKVNEPRSSSSLDLDTLRPQIIQRIMQKYKAEIVNELNTRIILKIDKDVILQCINDLKTSTDINWLVNQPSLYDVFIHFIK